MPDHECSPVIPSRSPVGSRFVAIGRFINPWDAHIACGRLCAEGIAARVAFDQHATACWPIVMALGGVRIMVPRAEAASASAILADQERGVFEACLPAEDLAAAALRCPACGSSDVATGRFGSLLPLLGLLAFFGAIFPVRLDRRRCRRCGHAWLY